MNRDLHAENLFANTQRFVLENGKLKRIGFSPNRGLECYLAEALCGAQLYSSTEAIESSVATLLSEARWIDKTMVWGWEREPSLPGVFFPADWDDTAKAGDYLCAAAKFVGLRTAREALSSLPSEEFWVEGIKRSLFIAKHLGVDVEIPTDSNLALSVFFGPGSERIPPREDLMVTIAVVRHLLLWQPLAVKELRPALAGLLRRCIFGLRFCLKNRIKFGDVSRYYFSLGHYAFRVLEVCELFGEQALVLCLGEGGSEEIRSAAKERAKLDALSGTVPNAYFVRGGEWWGLCVRRFIERNARPSSRIVGSGGSRRNLDVVFRHRRLGHFYASEEWHTRLIFFEESRYERTCHSERSWENGLPSAFLGSDLRTINVARGKP